MADQKNLGIQKASCTTHVVDKVTKSVSKVVIETHKTSSISSVKSSRAVTTTGEQQQNMEVKVSSKTPTQTSQGNAEVTIPIVKSSNTGKKLPEKKVEQVDVAESQGEYSHMVVFVPMTVASKAGSFESEFVKGQCHRPSSAKADYGGRCPQAPSKRRNSPPRNRRRAGSLYAGFSPSKSFPAGLVQSSLPDNEDTVTTKAWLRLYSLSSLNLDLNRLLEGPDCKHADDKIVTTFNKTKAKYCYLFPSINVNGTLKHLQLSYNELEQYEKQMELILRRYLKRLIWLLSGSRRVFGTLVHKQSVILIDTSGSMAPYIENLKKELVSLIWEQFYSRECSFNLICFSSQYEMWSEQLELATLDNCHAAMDWVLKLKTCGSTKTFEALKLAFRLHGVESVYLLTDGKPDAGPSELLKQTLEDNTRKIPVNTISFNCSDINANSFLQSLATQTGGRYHRCHEGFDAKVFVKRLLDEGMKNPAFPHLPTFESDDLSRLGQEICLARKYLQQVQQLRDLYKQAGRNQPGGVDRRNRQRTSVCVSEGGGQTRKPGPASGTSSHVPLKYNFFKDTYWVPGVWRKFWKYPPPKHVIAGMVDPLLPEKEEQITTEKWLTMYTVSMYKLHLSELVAGVETPSKFSDIYARFRVGGTKKYLRLLPQELVYYEILLERIYKRYLKRLYWLLSSSRLVFGTVIHKNCVIVVDTSGSMGPSMEIMKKALVALIWEQINSQECMFTVVDFSAHAVFWKESLQPSTRENCQAAITWISSLKAEGGTNTMEAVQRSLQVPNLDSVYLLSDGEPNQPPEEILQAVEKQFQNRIPINTISFNCKVDKANKFLESLATQTGGRYHRYRSDSKALELAPKLQNKELLETDFALLSQLEGDDLQKLVVEIDVCRKYLSQVRQYRELSKKKETERPFEWAKTSVWPRTKVHKFFVQRPSTYRTFMKRPKSAMD